MSTSSVLFDAPGPKALRRHKVGNLISALVVIGLGAFVIWRLADAGQFEGRLWEPMIRWSTWKNYFLRGLGFTLLASLISVVLALTFGMLLGIGRLSSNRIVRWLSGIVVEFFRAVPVLIMMIAAWIFLARSGYVPAQQSPLYAVIIGLTLYNGSIIAELVRSGVYGLPKGQREAGLAIGMTRTQSIRSIELPQALIAMLPALVSQFVIIIKDSALGTLVTYSELLHSARLLGVQNPLPILQSLFVAALIFIGVNYVLSKAAEALAARVGGRTSGRTRVPGVAPGAVVTAPMLGIPLDEDYPEDHAD